MSIVEIHPEDLIDKELRGELSSVELARLEAHVASCSTCGFERLTRVDFRDQLESEMRRSRAGSLDVFKVSPRPIRVFSSRRTRVAVLVLAAAIVMSVAAAAFPSVRQTFRSLSMLSESTSRGSPPARGGFSRRQPGDMFAKASRGEVTLLASTEFLRDAGGFPARECIDVGSRVPASTQGTSVPEHRAVVHNAGVVSDGPSVLFARASAALRRHDYSIASSLFNDLQTRFARSVEARASHVVLGRLALDRGDAERAFGLFQDFLIDGTGPLVEEATVGRARALEMLGRTNDEASAWSVVVSEFPDSPHAAHARTRLEALGVR